MANEASRISSEARILMRQLLDLHQHERGVPDDIVALLDVYLVPPPALSNEIVAFAKRLLQMQALEGSRLMLRLARMPMREELFERSPCLPFPTAH